MDILKVLLKPIVADILFKLEKPHYVREFIIKYDYAPATVEIVLSSLERVGLIHSYRDSGKKYFELTELGKKVVNTLKSLDEENT